MSEGLQKLQDRLGYHFRDPYLLELAMTHASASNTASESNERLEFLGDAVVGLLISEELFRASAEATEGDMSAVKSAVVSRRTLARVGRAIGLPEFLAVDEGLKQRPSYPVSMVAGVYEALLGAVFLDGGLEAARRIVVATLGPEQESAGANPHMLSYKSALQHRTQAEGRGAPRYTILRSEGPDHRRRFQVAAIIGGEQCGIGWGATKRTAEQNAARDALDAKYPGWADMGGSADEDASEDAAQ